MTFKYVLKSRETMEKSGSGMKTKLQRKTYNKSLTFLLQRHKPATRETLDNLSSGMKVKLQRNTCDKSFFIYHSKITNRHQWTQLNRTLSRLINRPLFSKYKQIFFVPHSMKNYITYSLAMAKTGQPFQFPWYKCIFLHLTLNRKLHYEWQWPSLSLSLQSQWFVTQLGDSQDSETFPISFKRTHFYVSHSTENNITRW